MQDVFAPRWTALVLPDGQAGLRTVASGLQVAASVGEALTSAELTSLVSGGQTRSLGFVDAETQTRVSVALVLDNRPVGILVLQDAKLAGERSLLGTFANQAALAVDGRGCATKRCGHGCSKRSTAGAARSWGPPRTTCGRRWRR